MTAESFTLVIPSVRLALATGRLDVTVKVTDARAVMASSRIMLLPFSNTPAIRTRARAAASISKIAVFGHAAFVSRADIVHLFLGCFGSHDCTGSISVSIGTTIVATRHGRLAGSNSGALVSVPPNPTGRRLLQAAQHQSHRAPERRDWEGRGVARTRTQIFLRHRRCWSIYA